MFQGQAPPFSTTSRLPPSPVGCAVVVLMIKPTEGARTTTAHPTGDGRSQDMVENGCACP